MKTAILTCVAALALVLGAQAQEIKLPVNLERLAAKASEVVDVNMDQNMLSFGCKFLNEKDPEQAQARKVCNGLKAIYVRSFTFEKAGEYSQQDVEELRSQLRPPAWSRIVGVRSKKDGENADVFFKMENGKIIGLAVIAAEPNEFTFVHIDGPIDPEMLRDLGGQFGIPEVEMPKSAPKKEPAKKEPVKKESE